MTNSDADLTKELLSNEFLSSKFDLEQTISRLMHYRQKFFLKFDNDEQRLNQSHPLLDIVVILNSMTPSFLAPAYHFNKYVDAIIKDIM